MDLIDYVKSCYGLYFNDERSYDEILDRFSFLYVFLVYFIFNFINFFILGLIDFWETSSEKSQIYLIFTYIINSLFSSFLGLLIFFFLFYFIVSIFNGYSNFKNTLKFGLSITFFSGLFMFIPTVLLTFIYRNVPIETFFLSSVNIVVLSIYLLLTLVVLIWSFVCLVNNMSRLHKISKSKVFVSLVIPIILMILLFILFIYIVIKISS